MMLSSATTTLCLVCCCILTFVARHFQRTLSSPLNAAKDAHWSVRYSGIWIWWQRVLERDAHIVHEAHLRHGPVVRLGPNELSINDIEGGLKPIYEQRMPKTDFYQVANSYGVEPMVAMRDEEPHRRQKRMVAKPYFKTSLMGDSKWKVEQSKLARDLICGLDDKIKTQSKVEMYDVFFAWSLASISTYVFGSSGCVNVLHDIPGARQMRHEYFSQRMYLFVPAVFPILSKPLYWLGWHGKIPFISEMQVRAETAESCTSDITAKDQRTSVYNYMRHNLSKDKNQPDHLPLMEKGRAILSSEMQDHIVAGLDTSISFLVGCAYQLSLEHNSKWQCRLRDELRHLSGSASPAIQDHDLTHMSTLDAIIKETLRLYPPVAGGQPRVTNRAVSLGPAGHEVEVPTGVKVHCQAQTLHRNGIFEDSGSWRPERWLDSAPEKRAEMERWLWAFGSGSRRCLGEHLGLSNLRVAIAAIWGNYETQVTTSTELILSQGMIALPLPNKEGDYMRLHVRSSEGEV